MEPIDTDTPMVVTDCPECDGTGWSDAAGQSVVCREDVSLGGGAWYNVAGRHVVPVETLDIDQEDHDPESGPEEGGVGSESEAAPAEEAKEGLDWPDDPIGVVAVGDDNGLAHFVTRALAASEGPFTEEMAAQVDEFREDCGLDEYPEGVIVGKVWAMVLPLVTVGTRGQVARWLCKVLELPPQNVVTQEVMAEAILQANPEYLSQSTDDAEDLVREYEFDMADWLAVL